MARIFVSFRESDKNYREAFEGLLQNPNTNFYHAPISARKDYRPLGSEPIRKYLNRLIKGCDALVCLIGENTHNSPWIGHELAVASSLKIGIAAIRIPDTRGGTPPLIKKKGIQIVKWRSAEINKALNRAIRYTWRHSKE